MKSTYDHAIAAKYRFFSYGDACLLEPNRTTWVIHLNKGSEKDRSMNPREIGQPLAHVDTPALIVDLDAFETNLRPWPT